MFPEKPTARADLKPGTLYAIAGERGWIYYGQTTSEKSVGFFQRRDREPVDADSVLAAPVMSIITISYPSITRALRAGRWKKLGRYPVANGLVEPHPSVRWSAGTLAVSVWIGNGPAWETRVDDPAIQEMELMAVWDAEQHLPARLTADFGEEEAEWHVGGPIRRERRIKEERAARWPDQPWNQLPPDWVSTNVS
ncbi:hypothetical protein [Sphingobium yanoikuyae]|uniref:Uncharacterized protein n=1 Tax=Sphingobium yanoikuyae ATCC 51230 TaxID=883163 RepID=K9DEK0_SPHYA|nr:hypothetical protein [Sphingobium yanoikuyae]EKU75870.1 hypothetical protein HMPREF9718_01222 [Sphingobium yanoikuyae ATCC 51230]SHL97916.1 hypothetical protein SAMN05518668_104434 [Sphingobium sp. YR657]